MWHHKNVVIAINKIPLIDHIIKHYTARPATSADYPMVFQSDIFDATVPPRHLIVLTDPLSFFSISARPSAAGRLLLPPLGGPRSRMLAPLPKRQTADYEEKIV